MKKILLVLPFVGLTLVLSAAPRTFQQLPDKSKNKEFMRRKLVHSQKVLEGVVLEDFDLIEKNAKMLSMLSQAAEWRVIPRVDYNYYSAEFRSNADALAKAAAEKNLDGAALKYVELTLNCVNCHKFIRGIRYANPEKPGGLYKENLRRDQSPVESSLSAADPDAGLKPMME